MMANGRLKGFVEGRFHCYISFGQDETMKPSVTVND